MIKLTPIIRKKLPNCAIIFGKYTKKEDNMDYKIGQILDSVITGIQPYGAFAALDDQTQGLIHVSEIQSGYTKNIHDVLQIGQPVKVQIIDIDEYSHKISLSRRILEKQFVNHNYRKKRYFTNKHRKIGFKRIDQELPIWIEDALKELSQAPNNLGK